MWLSEEEAKTKWCPFYRVSISGESTTDNRGGAYSPLLNENCIASDCIMWQKRKVTIADYHAHARYQPDGSYLIDEFGMKKIKEMEKMGYCKMARDY